MTLFPRVYKNRPFIWKCFPWSAEQKKKICSYRMFSTTGSKTFTCLHPYTSDQIDDTLYHQIKRSPVWNLNFVIVGSPVFICMNFHLLHLSLLLLWVLSPSRLFFCRRVSPAVSKLPRLCDCKNKIKLLLLLVL